MKTIEQPEKTKDEVMAEVRRHKLDIAAKHEFNVRSLAEDLRRRQQGHPRLVQATAKEGEKNEFHKP